jgi:hypothetical protein
MPSGWPQCLFVDLREIVWKVLCFSVFSYHSILVPQFSCIILYLHKYDMIWFVPHLYESQNIALCNIVWYCGSLFDLSRHATFIQCCATGSTGPHPESHHKWLELPEGLIPAAGCCSLDCRHIRQWGSLLASKAPRIIIIVFRKTSILNVACTPDSLTPLY